MRKLHHKLLSAVALWIMERFVAMSRQMKNDPPGVKRQGVQFDGAPARQQVNLPNLDVAAATADNQ